CRTRRRRAAAAPARSRTDSPGGGSVPRSCSRALLFPCKTAAFWGPAASLLHRERHPPRRRSTAVRRPCGQSKHVCAGREHAAGWVAPRKPERVPAGQDVAQAREQAEVGAVLADELDVEPLHGTHLLP